MKKLFGLLILFMFLSITEGFNSQDGAIILFNGKRLDFRAQPIMNEGTLCVPLEEFASQMNFSLLKKKGEYTLDDRFRQILFRVNQDQVEVNGQKAYLPMKVFFHDTDWYVPLNYLAWFQGYTLNRKDRFYYISKQVQKAEIDAGSLKVVFGCNIENEPFILKKEKLGYSIELTNSVLAFPRVIMRSPDLGVIQIGQISAIPDIAKILISVSDNIELVKQKNTLIVKQLDIATPVINETPKLSIPKPEPKIEKIATPRSTDKAVWLPNMSRIRDVTLMIRGKSSLIKGPALVIDGEYYLPADNILIPFGYDYQVDKSGRLQVKYGDKQELVLPISPTKVGDKWYISIQKTASSLGMGLRWDWRSKTLRINPIIYDVHYDKSPDAEAIHIHSFVEMSPRDVFALTNPPRLVLDIPNAVLDTKEKAFTISGSNFVNARAGQLNEDTVRVVVDLKQERNYALSLSDDGTTAFILGAGKVKKLHFSEENEQEKVVIETAAVSSYNVTLQGQQLQIDFHNAQYQAKPEYYLTGPYLSRVSGVQQSWSPLKARMTFILQKDVAANVSRVGDDIVVLIKKAMGAIKQKETSKASLVSTTPFHRGPLSGKTIVVEPGHGGIDVGSIGFGNQYEKTYNLDIAKRIQSKLIAVGANVIMPFHVDQYMSLAERTLFANRNKADLYLSCHLNSLDRSEMNGIESYFYKPEDIAPAKAIHEALLNKLGRVDRGLRKARFFVLFHTDMPAVLIEPAYFSNQEEYNLILTDAFREKIAEGVVEGIIHYYASR